MRLWTNGLTSSQCHFSHGYFKFVFVLSIKISCVKLKLMCHNIWFKQYFMMHHINGWYRRHYLYKSSPRCIIISSYSIIYCLWFIFLLFISTRAQTLNILAFEYTRNLQEIPNMELDIGQCAHYVEEVSPGVPVVRQW